MIPFSASLSLAAVIELKIPENIRIKIKSKINEFIEETKSLKVMILYQ
jgi:hypothetical protein